MADGLGPQDNVAPMSYDRSPTARHYQPGAWRNVNGGSGGALNQTSGTRR